MIRADVDFPGANPSTPQGIRWDGDRLVVRPFHEESAGPAYTFMVRFKLSVEERVPVTIEMDWDEPKYMHLRTVLHYAKEGTSDWRVLTGTVADGSRCEFRFDESPGRYDISLLPTYGPDRLDKLAGSCGETVEVCITEGENGTAGVHSFRLGSGGTKRPLLIAVGRVHPYETAGSYCLEGVVRRYVEDPEYSKRLTRSFDWVVVPVASPEGVRKGFCRHSGSGGLGYDNCREAGTGDPLVRLMTGLLETENVAGYLDIHNWMHQDRDGISYVNCLDMLRFRRLLNAERPHDKPWIGRKRLFCAAQKTRGLMRVMQRAGAFCLALEYPWGGRTVEEMARLGQASVLAFAGLAGKHLRR